LANPGGLRVGFRSARELNTFFQHRLIDVPREMTHAVEKNLLFASHFGCTVQADDFHLCSNSADKLAAEYFLHGHGIGAKDRFVYVNPTARWASKYWSAPRWSQLCDRLMDEGVRPVLGGSEADAPYIRDITDQMTTTPIVAAGHLSLGESTALISRASAYVGLDTGPMHIAAMGGVPVVALFGPTHPERVGPYGVGQVIIQAEGLDCLCCRKRVCERMDCMRGIGVEQVFSGIMELL